MAVQILPCQNSVSQQLKLEHGLENIEGVLLQLQKHLEIEVPYVITKADFLSLTEGFSPEAQKIIQRNFKRREIPRVVDKITELERTKGEFEGVDFHLARIRLIKTKNGETYFLEAKGRHNGLDDQSIRVQISTQLSSREEFMMEKDKANKGAL